MLCTIVGWIYPVDGGQPCSQGGPSQHQASHWHRLLEVLIHDAHLREEVRHDLHNCGMDLPSRLGSALFSRRTFTMPSEPLAQAA